MTNWKKQLTALLLACLLLAGAVVPAALAEEGSEPQTLTLEQSDPAAENSAKNASPKKIKISGSKYVAKGKKIKLTATVSPADASQKVTWRSENPAIATVDKKGNV